MPTSWNTSYRVVDRTLVIPFTSTRRIISSAVYGGGIVHANGILNHQVINQKSPAYDFSREKDPSRYLGELAKRLKVHGRCVGLMTAVDMRCLVLQRVEAEGLWIEGFFTVGVSNAVRAGDAIVTQLPTKTEIKIGTINIILITNARLSSAAMVCAVGVATESKTAMLFSEDIKNMSGTHVATGTGTDVVAVASGQGPFCRFSGTHTKMGELIGRVVSQGIKKGLQKYRAWRNSSMK
ncbi:adenosylcobinamide amidohydrolase [Candidatus Nitrospira salsa]